MGPTREMVLGLREFYGGLQQGTCLFEKSKSPSATVIRQYDADQS
jgi:hypothetical protein